MGREGDVPYDLNTIFGWDFSMLAVAEASTPSKRRGHEVLGMPVNTGSGRRRAAGTAANKKATDCQWLSLFRRG